jgi:hypothetical protein
MQVEIRKPIYSNENGDFVCVRDKYINLAIKRRETLFVKSKNTSGEFFPKWIRATAKKMKKEFLIKGVPMVLFCWIIPLNKGKTEEEKMKEFSKLCL